MGGLDVHSHDLGYGALACHGDGGAICGVDALALRRAARQHDAKPIIRRDGLHAHGKAEVLEGARRLLLREADDAGNGLAAP